ncbi:hypothetical protein MIMGU_mgv1a023644mg [Erythranthe guttata]|uniref:F-box domain-containing protein n=1 Tax=Erythranthe guttata TaxID=4155 RepID=A0A022R1E7_ERYGU|nr:PREDICTED: F-box protein CPR30-like [Erythranthe guttata]EYU32635.1 hypothetical protein MIMGU_mgv1a023644mg [Erythranthe guttata]|eukprot:XP_012843123.1 PREDICTED: F-box protein CPR30-like [Erythranthe guttata]
MASYDVPNDIVENILLRLTAKHLRGLKAVCKSWNTMISDPVFIQTHLHRSKYSHLFQSKLSLNYYGEGACSSSSSARSRDKYRLFELQGEKKFLIVEELVSPYSGWKAVLCSCNGVLLLTDSLSRLYVLWNPSIRAETEIWFPYDFYDRHMSYGLCHDPTFDDFKVVFICLDYYAVFSCKNNSWSMKNRFSYTGRVKNYSRGIFVDGAIYWVWRRETRVEEIVYFDPSDDKLRVLERPKYVEERGKPIYLADLGGRLCVYCNGRDKSVVRIWTKELKGSDGGSWKEVMTVENVRAPVRWLRPLCFLGDKIVIRLNVLKIVVYCPREKTFEEVGVEGFRLSSFELVPYMDSLLFPTRTNKQTRKRKYIEST